MIQNSSRVAGDQRDNRALSRLTARFGRVATAVAATAMVMAPLAANAQDNSQAAVQNVSTTQIALRTTPHCAPLFRNNVGREIDASYSAWKYSEDNPGKVGISIFAGQDLGEYSPEYLGTALVNSLGKRGVEAECFVHHEAMPNGTGVDFKIAGLSWGKDQSLSISEALNKEMVDRVAAEAKTARSLLASSDNTGNSFNP